MDNEKMHVLVVATWYPNGADKLIGVYHKTFCRALVKSGKAEVGMLYVDRQGISSLPRYPMMQKAYIEKNEGYTTFCRRMLDVSKFSFSVQMRAYTRTLMRLYRDYEKRFGRPDVIHAQVTVPAGYAACVLGETIGVPVLITEHSSYFERFFSGKEGKFGRYAAEHARMTCVSQYMADTMRDQFGISASVLPNIVDLAAFSAPKQRAKDGVFRIASVSALRPGKCIDEALAALKILRDRKMIGPFLYTVVGDGQEAAFYQDTAEKLDLSACVRFVGRKNESEIAQILSKTDALLIASDVETFAIPAVEALAAGVPVISTRCKGPEGFLNETCAEFCNVHDPEDMARAILRMYHRIDRFDERKVRAVAAQFDSAAVAELALSVYKEICNQ